MFHLLSGDIEVRRGLDTTYATIACRNSDHGSNHMHDIDLLVLLKLLPFGRKLELFCAQANQLTADAVLSDLVDEQVVFYEHMLKHGPLHKKKLSNTTGMLQACHLFKNHDFSNVSKVHGGTQVFTQLLVKFRFLASFYHFKTCTGSTMISIKLYVRDLQGPVQVRRREGDHEPLGAGGRQHHCAKRAAERTANQYFHHRFDDGNRCLLIVVS